MAKFNKTNISNILNYTGLTGLIILIIAMLLESAHRIKPITEPTKVVVFSVFTSFILLGAIISGVVGTKGIPVERANNPIAYWLIISGYLFFVILVLVKGIQT